MLEDGILVAEQFLSQQPNLLHDLQLSFLALTDQDRHSERPNLINQLVMSCPSTYAIVPTVFFKLFLWQTSTQHLFILKVLEGSGRGSIVLR